MTIPAVNRSRLGGPAEGGDHTSGWSPGLGLASRFSTNLLEERERWFLWLPVALASGIGAYFSLDWEPSRVPTAVMTLAILVSCWVSRRRPALLYGLFAVLAVVVGFGAAQLRTASIEGPLILKRTPPGLVTGTVAEIEPAGRRWRVTLEGVRLEHLAESSTPEKVRIVLRHDDQPPDPGARVSLTAVLMPLPRPAMPDAFDFARHAFFQGLGGVGYALSILHVEERLGGGFSLGLLVSTARQEVANHIIAALDDGTEAGLVRRSLAEALLIGQRGAIPEEVVDAMRDSGLAHILAISGLHIGLVAGFVFFVVRAGLALIAPLALRHPIRKWAAGTALLVAFGYVLLAGATVPTQRAFLMLGIGLIAIVTDRFQINMRPVAWAAITILLVMPESLVGASFQLSFAAVIALVAAYEAVRARWRGIGVGAGFPRDPTRARTSVIALYFLAVAFTSVVATLATAPFAITSFNRLAVYGLAANLAAVPVTAFWIMPWGIIAMVLMPVGLDAAPLIAMAWGLDALTWVAHEVASWPGAVLLVPAMPPFVPPVVALGGLWLTLWRRSWRLFGIPVMIAGLLTGALSKTPDVMLSDDGSLVAVRYEADALWASSLTREKFTRGVWMQRLALPDAEDWHDLAHRGDSPLVCDALGCVLGQGKAVVALPHDARALLDDCAIADAVLATVPVDRSLCRRPALVIDRFDLWREGAHAVWLHGPEIAHRSVREAQGLRPWSTWPD